MGLHTVTAHGRQVRLPATAVVKYAQDAFIACQGNCKAQPVKSGRSGHWALSPEGRRRLRARP